MHIAEATGFKCETIFVLQGSSLRPTDLLIHTFENGQAVAADVSVGHPLHHMNTTYEVGFVSTQRELSKEKLYHDICVRAGLLFFPVVVKTKGGLGGGQKAWPFCENCSEHIVAERMVQQMSIWVSCGAEYPPLCHDLLPGSFVYFLRQFEVGEWVAW